MARDGIRDWKIQRFTALFLLFYSLFIFGFILRYTDLSFDSWHALFTHPVMQICTLFALFAVAWHAWIGLWIVLTDYIKSLTLRYICQSIILFMLFAYVVWGIFILWGN